MKRPPDRDAIEALLHADEKKSVREWCRYRRIPVESWPCHSGASAWVDLAVGRAADKAMADGRAALRAPALDLVCPALGLDGRSVRRRWERKEAEMKRSRRAA